MKTIKLSGKFTTINIKQSAEELEPDSHMCQERIEELEQEIKEAREEIAKLKRVKP